MPPDRRDRLPKNWIRTTGKCRCAVYMGHIVASAPPGERGAPYANQGVLRLCTAAFTALATDPRTPARPMPGRPSRRARECRRALAAPERGSRGWRYRTRPMSFPSARCSIGSASPATSSPSGSSRAAACTTAISSLSEDFLSLTLQGRTAQVEMQLLDHSIRAIDELALDPREIGTVISSTSTRSAVRRSRTASSTTTRWTRRPTSTTSPASAARAPCRCSSSRRRRCASTPTARAGGRSGEHERLPDEPSTRTRARRPSARRSSATAAPLRCSAADPQADGPLILDSQVHQIAGTLGAVELRVQRRRQPPAPRRASCPTWRAPGWARSSTASSRATACSASRSTTGSCIPAGGGSSRT